MEIKINPSEFILMNEFELSWRWDKIHCDNISKSEIDLIKPVSVAESKNLNKVIDFFESEMNISNAFSQSGWIYTSSENEIKFTEFQDKLAEILKPFDENLIITWNRSTTVYTTKEIFIKYWADFLYPSSDNVTIISELTNWVMFYRHIEVANIWVRKNHYFTS